MTSRSALSLCLLALLCGCPVVFDDGGPSAGRPGRAPITRSTPEAPGEACPNGGVRVEHGVDDDGDGTLSDVEVDGAAFVCDGPDGDVVLSLLVEVDEAPASACGSGGTRVRVGRDGDGDATLDEDETSEQAVVCDGGTGPDGAAGLVRVSPELPGASCPAGGQRVDAGLDADGDAILDESEVALTRYLCDGEDGATGDPGSDAPLRLVRVVAEPSGEQCLSGGQRVETGLDGDDDGALGEDEIEGVAYVCDAEGEGVVLGAGRVEGTAALPIPLVVDAAEPRLSSVAALGTSFYTFPSASGPAPYTVRILGEDSTLVVRLFDDATLSNERTLTCTREPPRVLCTSEALPPDTSFLLVVSDAAEIANSFGLSVDLGADLGSADAPVALTDDAGAATGVRATVGRAGQSAFSFRVATAEAYTLSLESAVSSGGGGLSWRIEDEVGVRARCSDASAPCPAGYLAAGTTYRLYVAAAGRGAAFDVQLTEGDAITAVLPLDETVTLDDMVSPLVRVFQIRTTTSTRYTFRSYDTVGSRYLSIYDAPPETEGRHASDVLSDRAVDDGANWIDTGYEGYVDFLAPDRVYYIAIGEESATPTSPLFHVASRGGDEADVPLTLGAPYPGSQVRESSYTFTTGATRSRYTITFDTPLGAHNTITDVWITDVAADDTVAVLETPTFARESDDHIVVTPELDPGLAMKVSIGSYTPMTYRVLVEEGDVVTSPLALDSPRQVTLAGGGVSYFSVDVAAPTPATLTSGGGNGQVMVSDTWPESAGDPYSTIETVYSCSGSACTGDLVLPPGRSFLSLENPLPFEQTFTVELVTATQTIALDEPIQLTLASKEAARFWYVNDSEVVHQLVVDLHESNRDHRVRVRRASDFGVEYETVRDDNDGSYYVPSGSSGTPLPVGAWVFEVDMDNGWLESPFTVTLIRP